MSDIIDVPTQEVQEEKPNAQEQLQNLINNELRFAEETIIRALRSVVVNVVNALQSNNR